MFNPNDLATSAANRKQLPRREKMDSRLPAIGLRFLGVCAAWGALLAFLGTRASSDPSYIYPSIGFFILFALGGAVLVGQRTKADFGSWATAVAVVLLWIALAGISFAEIVVACHRMMCAD